MATPYKTTSVFDAETLPPALRREHSTKAGVWGVIRVLEGRLRLAFGDGRDIVLDPQTPGLIQPQQVHFIEPLGPIRMQVEFYDNDPAPPVS